MCHDVAEGGVCHDVAEVSEVCGDIGGLWPMCPRCAVTEVGRGRGVSEVYEVCRDRGVSEVPEACHDGGVSDVPEAVWAICPRCLVTKHTGHFDQDTSATPRSTNT